MINIDEIQTTMLGMLEEYTGCTLVPTNTTEDMPAYPYISFTLINIDTRKGTYSRHTATKIVEGEEIATTLLTMPEKLKYSFTAQSDNDTEALIIAMKVKDFFEEAKLQALADKEIIVADVGGITPRDNMLTIEYEYRKGLDVTLSLNNIIEDTTTDIIEKTTLTSETVGEINIEKE